MAPYMARWEPAPSPSFTSSQGLLLMIPTLVQTGRPADAVVRRRPLSLPMRCRSSATIPMSWPSARLGAPCCAPAASREAQDFALILAYRHPAKKPRCRLFISLMVSILRRNQQKSPASADDTIRLLPQGCKIMSIASARINPEHRRSAEPSAARHLLPVREATNPVRRGV